MHLLVFFIAMNTLKWISFAGSPAQTQMNGQVSLTALLTPQGCSAQYKERINALSSLWLFKETLFLVTTGEMAAFELLIEKPGCDWEEFKQAIKKHLPEIQQVQAAWTIDSGEVKQLNRAVES